VKRKLQKRMIFLPNLNEIVAPIKTEKRPEIPITAVTTYGVKVLLWKFSASLFEYIITKFTPVKC
jgi:hypothetical protein